MSILDAKGNEFSLNIQKWNTFSNLTFLFS